MQKFHKLFHLPQKGVISAVLALAIGVSACQPGPSPTPVAVDLTSSSAAPVNLDVSTPEPAALATPFPARPQFAPGELVDYIVQGGDSLPALAARFNTNEGEIRQANPIIPAQVTTLPPGMPMKIPIYYLPLWGTSYQIIPDSLFINGPAQVGFDAQSFIDLHPGWLKDYTGYVAGYPKTSAQMINLVALNYSISPRLLLALLEYHAGALSQPEFSPGKETNLLGNTSRAYQGLYRQLVWAANSLNNGYYDYRSGNLTSMELLNGRIEQPDPWQNAATVALQYHFSRLMPQDQYQQAISPDGFAAVYRSLFGDPWETSPHIPGSLTQPEFLLPFEPGSVWAFTGGPHTGWGSGEPLAAIDFAPPSVKGGCIDSGEWVTAVAAGVIARSEPAVVVLDLDGDGDERTGWIVFYLHLATEGRAAAGTIVRAGDLVGHPSCEGGRSTGTHVHIARKYNGEWILASGVLAFNLEGWIANNGPSEYLGTLTRYGQTVRASIGSDETTHIRSDFKP